MQFDNAIEKRQLRKDEEEYEKNQLRKKLDEEVWEDLIFEEDEGDKVELNIKEKNEIENDIFEFIFLILFIWFSL